MTITYTGPNSDEEKVRLRIGDTDDQEWSMSDAEITESLTLESNVDKAAVLAHEWYMVRLAAYIADSAGGQTNQLQQRYQQHEKHHIKLVARARKSGTSSCYAGGISKDRIDDLNSQADYPQPFAKVGQDDYSKADVADDDTRGCV